MSVALEDGERVLESAAVKIVVERRAPLGRNRWRRAPARLILTESRVLLAVVELSLLALMRARPVRRISHEIPRGRLALVEASPDGDSLRVQSDADGYAMIWFEVLVTPARWWAARLIRWNRTPPEHTELPVARVVKR